jgi:multiple sugar transport system ATP-binding protein
MATVQTRELTKRFDRENAVDGIDLMVHESEFLVMLGPSGCGKTTLLRMLAGLEKPTSGDVLIGGRLVTHLPPRARNIAMVFQSYALYPHLSVYKNIAFPLRAMGASKRETDKKVGEAAAMFGIGHLLGRQPRQLSGGERQRVALARAVVRNPVVFLLDEPLSNLDAKLRMSARDELQQFQRRLATTTVYVTHDQVEAMGLGDRIAVLNHGRIHQIGTPLSVYRDPADTFVATFIGSPPMNLVEIDGVLCGFRPENLLPSAAFGHAGDAGDIADYPITVTRVEHLGADRLVYGILDSPNPEAKVIARLPANIATPVEPGMRHAFGLRRRDIRYFDLKTGLRRNEAGP